MKTKNVEITVQIQQKIESRRSTMQNWMAASDLWIMLYIIKI